MKRILGIAALTGLLAAAPAFAGVDVFFEFGTPAPVYVAPAPVYASPVVYRHGDPRWFERHERFDRHFYRDHHEFREHRGYRDYRDRH